LAQFFITQLLIKLDEIEPSHTSGVAGLSGNAKCIIASVYVIT